jgi:hypothetical protein
VGAPLLRPAAAPPPRGRPRGRLVVAIALVSLLIGGGVAAAIVIRSNDEPQSSSTAAHDTPPRQPLSRSEYIAAVNDAQKTFADGAAKLDLARPESHADFKKALDGLDPYLATMISDLDALEPPPIVKAEHERLVSSTREYRDLLNATKGGLTSDDAARADQADKTIRSASGRFSKVLEQVVGQMNDRLG